MTGRFTSRTTLKFAGGCSLLLGGLALAGWLFHLPTLTRLGSASPIAANSAAGLVLNGAALLLIAGGWTRVAIAATMGSLIAGLLTLVEYGFSVDLRIDQMLVLDYIGAYPANPGRMSPNTAVCLVLSGAALLWVCYARLRRTGATVAGVLGAVVLALGSATVAGYLTGIAMHTWGERTQMACTAGLGFTAVGLGILTLAWELGGRDRLGWHGLAVVCIGMTLTLCLSQAVKAEALSREEASRLPSVVLGVGGVISLLLVFVVQLASASKRRAEELHTICSELAAIYANAPVALLVVDEHLRVEKANDLAAAITGCDSASAPGLSVGPVIGCLNALASSRGCGHGPNCDRCQIRRVVLDSLRNGVKQDGLETWVPTSADGSGESRCMLVSSAAMEFDGRKALVCVQDITAIKQAEQELRESRSKVATTLAEAEAVHSLLAAAFTAQHDAILVFNAEGRLLLTNPQAVRHLGTDACGLSLPEVIQRLRIEGGLPASATLRALCGQNVVDFEQRARDRVLEVSSAPMLDAAGKIIGAVTVMHDITERRRALDEKTALLKEVHHRVKNNLAVVSSLLSMKAARTAIAECRLALSESQQRIRSIALIHEQLYGTEHLDRIDFARYAEQLVAELNVASGADERGIVVKVNSEPIELEVDRAVPCALIMHELVSNALKHAFPGNRRGEVRIAFRRAKSGWLELEIADDGVGCPSDQSEGDGLGLRIVQILVRQLDGSIGRETNSGTCFVLRFPAIAV